MLELQPIMLELQPHILERQPHMVIGRQEQNPIMNFTVPFLKNAHTAHALESSNIIEFLCRLVRSSDLDLVTTIQHV